MKNLLQIFQIGLCCSLLWLPADTRWAQPSTHEIASSISVTGTPVTITSIAFQTGAPCNHTFVTHTLDHTTSTADGIVRMFEANGAGLAVNDLDKDGDLDLALGNHAGPNSIFWNEGSLTFRKSTFGSGYTRALTSIDVDNDGRRDLILSLNTGAVNYWRNLGNNQFERLVLRGITHPAYTLNWGDLDGDGDLDLVTASYDAGFLTDVGNNYLLEAKGGVYLYENHEGQFHAQRLAKEAQALTLGLFDINGDHRLDILVGNDFAVRDQAWVWSQAGWRAVEPFANTTHSTMSLDQGDIDNDGVPELMAADMKPYTHDATTMAAWEPLMMAMMDEEHAPDDPQMMANVLQMRNGPGNYVNRAVQWRVDGTGWSWSSKFGDLDNDGYLDLYVVNGMIEEKIFAHLPNHELVEENQAFRNNGAGRFVPMPAWGLNSRYSGRALVMADLDEDGDLDMVVNNLRGPAQLFENQLCGGASLEVDLQQTQWQNRDAIGAQVILQTNKGIYLRDVRAASGYLSGDAPRLHFGFAADAKLFSLQVRWPDGAMTVLANPPARQRLTLVR